MENLRIHCVTYNVQRGKPDADFGSLLVLNGENDVDFYVISFQEVPIDLVKDSLHEDIWTRKFMALLGSRHIKIKTIKVKQIGLVLNVFANAKHLSHISDIDSSASHRIVIVRFCIYGTQICFVNSHLSPHDNRLSNRIQEYNDAIQNQEFHVREFAKILNHDYTIWMGDLNFRLTESYDKNPEEIEQLVERGELAELRQHDQLLEAKRTKQAFAEFTEEDFKFAPTFKFKVGQGSYDHKRRPAWCDRMLYKFNESNVNLHIEQKSYQSHPDYTLSDHKPVTADFVIKVFADYGEEVIKFPKIPFWWDNEDNTVTYEFSRKFVINRNDWIGVYKENFNSIDEYEFHEHVAKPASPSPKAKQELSPRLKTKQPQTASSTVLDEHDPIQKISITFKANTHNKYTGKYRLIYMGETEDKVWSILGMSDLFEIREHSKK